MKTKELISCTFTVQLMCAFVFAVSSRSEVNHNLVYNKAISQWYELCHEKTGFLHM